MSALHISSGSGADDIEGRGHRRRHGNEVHFHIGQQVRVLLTGPPQTFTLSGIVRFGTLNNLAGATIAAFDLPTAQKIFDRVGQYGVIERPGQAGGQHDPAPTGHRQGPSA